MLCFTPEQFTALRGLAASILVDCNTRAQKTEINKLVIRCEQLADTTLSTAVDRQTAAMRIIDRGHHHRTNAEALASRTLQEQRIESFYVRALAILEPTVTF